MRISILGAGWLGRALAISLKDLDYSVKASSRNIDNLEDLKEKAIKIYELNYNKDVGVIGDLEFFSCDYLIICISPGRNNTLRNDYADAISAYLKVAKSNNVKAIFFTSTTGVYGNSEAIFTEVSQIDPQTPSAQLVAKAESLLLNSDLPIYILRLAGLVGPKRIPGTFLAGKKEVPDPNTPVNLVDQASIIKVITLLMQKDSPPGIYNIVSDEHPSREIYYTKQALKLGLDPPEFDFSTESLQRIISNDKIKATLNLDHISLEQ